MNILIFDFEVFTHNTLLGIKFVSPQDNSIYQTWDLNEMKNIYEIHKNDIWIGHNNSGYDNYILQAILEGKTEEQIKKESDDIIQNHSFKYLNIHLLYYDLMTSHKFALKHMEAYDGKNISETQVDFNLSRKLTETEMRLTESYNRDDLNQTYDDFIYLKYEVEQRLAIIKEFKLPLEKCLHITGTRLAEEVLHAKKIPGIETWEKQPELWPTLKLKNEKLKDYYLNRRWVDGSTLKLNLCGVEHTVAAGGIHAAKSKYHTKWAYYFDVSGYYNLIMINLDLLPRSIPKEYRELYEYMYREQLKLKGVDDNKRGVYKTILLSVFGAMSNEYCRFYDPYNGDLVRLSGQLYLVDLLEKLEGYVEVVQSNTDGIIVEPINNTSEEKIKEILDEWQNRTKFVLKFEKVYDIHQRDVNCYMCKDEKGMIKTHGENITHYEMIHNPFYRESYLIKEPLILAYTIVNYFINNKLPEQTIEENKRNLQLFQYICKKSTFDYVEYELTKENCEPIITKIQAVNRAFAGKNGEYNGMIYKCKNRNGKISRAKISNLPNSIIIHNDEILSDSAINELLPKIDWSYYIKRSYEKISTFYDIKQIKDIKL